MNAKLLPLEGKYYGTEIHIIDEELGIDVDIEVWGSGDYEPSDRELEGVCTIEEWRENKLIAVEDNYYNVEGVPAQDWIEVGSHTETRSTHAFALKLVDLINEGVQR